MLLTQRHEHISVALSTKICSPHVVWVPELPLIQLTEQKNYATFIFQSSNGYSRRLSFGNDIKIFHMNVLDSHEDCPNYKSNFHAETIAKIDTSIYVSCIQINIIFSFDTWWICCMIDCYRRWIKCNWLYIVYVCVRVNIVRKQQA